MKKLLDSTRISSRGRRSVPVELDQRPARSSQQDFIKELGTGAITSRMAAAFREEKLALADSIPAHALQGMRSSKETGND